MSKERFYYRFLRTLAGAILSRLPPLKAASESPKAAISTVDNGVHIKIMNQQYNAATIKGILYDDFTKKQISIQCNKHYCNIFTVYDDFIPIEMESALRTAWALAQNELSLRKRTPSAHHPHIVYEIIKDANSPEQLDQYKVIRRNMSAETKAPCSSAGRPAIQRYFRLKPRRLALSKDPG